MENSNTEDTFKCTIKKIASLLEEIIEDNNADEPAPNSGKFL